jgi:hypothetical protein
MLPAPNSRGAHGLSALPEISIKKQRMKSRENIGKAAISVFTLHEG